MKVFQDLRYTRSCPVTSDNEARVAPYKVVPSVFFKELLMTSFVMGAVRDVWCVSSHLVSSQHLGGDSIVQLLVEGHQGHSRMKMMS